MKLNYLSLTIVLSVIFIGLSTWVVLDSNKEVAEAIEARKQMNALEQIVGQLGPHPVFNEDLVGKVVVLNVWAGWCRPCLNEIPELNEMYQAFKGDNIRFIALSSEDEGSDNAALEKAGLFFDYEKLSLSPKEIKVLQSLKLDHEGRGIPLNIILDREGHIVHYAIGYSEENVQQMREIISSL